MDKNFLSHCIYYNLRSYILYLTKISGWNVYDISNVLINTSSSSEPLFNFAFLPDNYFSSYNAKPIKECLNIIKKRKISVSWVIDDMMAASTRCLIEKFGLNLINAPKKAILPIKDYVVPKNYDITLQKVNSQSTLIKFDACTSSIFYHEKNIVKNFFRGLSKIDNNKIQFFLVKLNHEEIVGTCGLYIENNIAGFYSDGVLEKYRKQGIGTQIVLKRIEIAQQNNCSHVIAHCMNPSVNLYERLGFKMLGNLYLYV